MSNEVMKEALAAIEGRVTLAPEKMPADATLVGIRLERTGLKQGRRVETIGTLGACRRSSCTSWITTGIAVAIRNGHVIAGNALFGRWTVDEAKHPIPKTTAMHWLKCPDCGRRAPMPVCVFEAKDIAEKKGVKIPRNTPGSAILREYGSCPCGGRWHIDDAGEKAELAAFSAEVVDAMSAMEKVPAFLAPRAFTVGKPGGEMPADWTWLGQAMAAAGQAVSPFAPGDTGDVILYNPGFWVGWVTDHNLTDLFWVEGGREKNGRRSPTFDPGAVNGL